MITITNTGPQKTTVTIDGKEFNIEPGCDLSISESKPEPTPEPQKITCWEDAFRKLKPRYFIDINSDIISFDEGSINPDETDHNLCHTEKDAEKSLKFQMRLLIAAACGAREFVNDVDNWCVVAQPNSVDYAVISTGHYKRITENYFHTKESAEEYLQACLNSGLL